MAEPGLPRYLENRSQAQLNPRLFSQKPVGIYGAQPPVSGRLAGISDPPGGITDLTCRFRTLRPHRLAATCRPDLDLAVQSDGGQTAVVAHAPHNSGWRLFRLCQHLGLNAADLQQLDTNDLQAMLAVLDEFTLTERSKVWLTGLRASLPGGLFPGSTRQSSARPLGRTRTTSRFANRLLHGRP